MAFTHSIFMICLLLHSMIIVALSIPEDPPSLHAAAASFSNLDFGSFDWHVKPDIVCNAAAVGYGGTDLNLGSCRDAYWNFEEHRADNLTIGQRNHLRSYDLNLPYRVISSEFSCPKEVCAYLDLRRWRLRHRHCQEYCRAVSYSNRIGTSSCGFHAFE